jgi:hypothetical protein
MEPTQEKPLLRLRNEEDLPSNKRRGWKCKKHTSFPNWPFDYRSKWFCCKRPPTPSLTSVSKTKRFLTSPAVHHSAASSWFSQPTASTSLDYYSSRFDYYKLFWRRNSTTLRSKLVCLAYIDAGVLSIMTISIMTLGKMTLYHNDIWHNGIMAMGIMTMGTMNMGMMTLGKLTWA